MQDIIVYIVDNRVIVLYKDRVIDWEFKSVDKGFIINREVFIQEFLGLIKKEKIKSKILGDKIGVLKNAFYGVADLAFLEGIWQDLGFLKVQYWDIREFLAKKNVSYVEINKGYMVLYLDKGIYLDLTYFKDISKIMGYFREWFWDDVVLFGTNEMIPKVKIKDKNVYYIDSSGEYILQCLLKVKKYGV